MLKIYDFDQSPNCLKTKILVKELGIAYEERWLTRAELQSPEFRAMFPSGQAPAIEDGEIRLAESGAIALYLAEKHQQLLPEAAPLRARMWQALFVEASLLAPTVGGQGLFGELAKAEPERNQSRIVELQSKAVRVGQILSQLLDSQLYFAGEFSVADIQLYAAISKSLAHGVFGEAPNNLRDWNARMNARPAVRAARAEYVHYRSAAQAA